MRRTTINGQARVREGVGNYSRMSDQEQSRDQGHVVSAYSEMWLPNVVNSRIGYAYKQPIFPYRNNFFQ